MKHTLAALMLTTSLAHAGGLAEPIGQVSPNPPLVSLFDGPYVGIFGGQRTVTTDTPDVYVRECRFGDVHRDRKCAFTNHFASPEIQTLEEARNPWNDPVMGRYDTTFAPVVYDTLDGIMWGAADSVFTYTTSNPNDPDPVRGKNAENVLVDVITETVSEAETYGIFAGYRKPWGDAILGVEVAASEDMQTLDAQLGLPSGQALFYGFAGGATSGDLSGYTYGAGVDLHVTESVFVGGQYRIADFGGAVSEGLTARVGFAF